VIDDEAANRVSRAGDGWFWRSQALVADKIALRQDQRLPQNEGPQIS
jgi:hypothetical protein